MLQQQYLVSFQKQYLTRCSNCGGKTSKKYAKEHTGQCKVCVTGESGANLYKCPDCGERRLTLYQKRNGYHCDTCTRNVEQTGGVYGW